MVKKICSLSVAWLLVTGLFAQDDQQIVFDTPAQSFTQSAPLGNGQLGAMVFGDPHRERIVINEKTMWSGGVEDPNRKGASRYLPQIQQLLKEGKNKAAQELLQQYFTCEGPGSGRGAGAQVKFGCYQVFGDLLINWQDSSGAVTNYSRILDLDKALATTTWTIDGVTYKEEVISSAPQNVLLIRLTASKPKALHFTIAFTRKENAQSTAVNNTIVLTGQLPSGQAKGIQFGGFLKVNNEGGKIASKDSALTVTSASECLIVLSAATDLNWPAVDQRGPMPLPIAKKRVEEASKISWDRLMAAHIADYQSFYYRCRFQLGFFQQDLSKLSTQERLLRFEKGEKDITLPALYFNFGRYLLISSSRPGGLPANLQGIWAEEYQTPWNGDYHLNINVQMNYWPAEVTNLSDCHQPLIQYIRQLVEPGQKTAKAYYNTDGWVAHVIANPWKFTAPGEGAEWGSTLTCGAWLCEHLWQHYSYNPNDKTLNEIYPVLKGAATFYKNILIEDPVTKWLVTAPSNSPENTYRASDGFEGQTTMGPTIDMQIGRELLGNTIAAAILLEEPDTAFVSSLMATKDRLAPNQVSKKTGGVQEWLRDYDETDPKHRHVSQLYGLHPFNEINTTQTPELAAAARKTLERRGDEGTGWSRAWKVNFWARLGDGDHALKVLKGLMIPATKNTGTSMSGSGAGTYANLFCAHPPFQIDGNFGGTAGIAEMLLQSREGVIELLPALPGEWKDGQIQGICAKGGYEFSMKWVGGKLVNCTMLSKYGGQCIVKYKNALKKLNTKPGVVYSIAL